MTPGSFSGKFYNPRSAYGGTSRSGDREIAGQRTFGGWAAVA
jgi:hypothetical protein